MAWAGCNDGNAPPIFPDDAGVDGGEDGGEADLHTPEDLLPPADLLPAVDLLPISCTSACDCPAGQRCDKGMCNLSAVMIFCCGAPSCTGANICETPSGKVGQCETPDAGFRPDMGAGATCDTIPCIPGLGSAAFCTVVCGQSATCSGTTNHCSP